MATREEAIAFLEKLREAKPSDSINPFTSKYKGISFVLKYIYKHEGKTYTSDISKDMHISTARVSALINKLEDRGFVTRQESKTDARKTVIVLTKKGANFVKEMEEALIQSTMHLIDTVGMEDLTQFLRIANNIKNAMQDYVPFHRKLEDFFND